MKILRFWNILFEFKNIVRTNKMTLKFIFKLNILCEIILLQLGMLLLLRLSKKIAIKCL